MTNVFFGIFLVSLVGCASVMPAPTDKIEALPLVKLGAVPPSSGEYVLYIPAHSPVPVKLTVKGTLLEQDTPEHSDLILTTYTGAKLLILKGLSVM